MLPRVRRVAGQHPQIVDGLLAAALVIPAVIAMVFNDNENTSDDVADGFDIGPGLTTANVTAGVLAFVLITVRRRWPLPAFIVSTVVTVAFGLGVGLLPQLLMATVACAYTIGAHIGRRTAWISGVVAATGIYAAAVIHSAQGWAEPENVTILAWIGMAIAISDLIRTRRAYVAAVLDRAQRAEQSREEEAHRRVIEERLRIARELHDVVAHSIAMINVQAGVAAHVLRQQPDQAEKSLAHIRQAARTVLEELSTVLGVLRSSEDPTEAPGDPVRGLSRLTDLLTALAGTGLQVEHTQNGTPRGLPAAVDLAAFRIVQEALTNARKHGTGNRVHLQLAYTPEGLTITVDNGESPGGPRDGARTGYGLVGMRERAAAIGGTLDTGSNGRGRFVVKSFLPAPVTREADQ
jgi:signal transduction histidine kinase